jgi:hypothetical protein
MHTIIFPSGGFVSDLYKPNVEAIQKAVDATAKSISFLATAGKMSRAVFAKYKNPNSRFTKAKANGVVLALNENGASVTFDQLFSLIEEKNS